MSHLLKTFSVRFFYTLGEQAIFSFFNFLIVAFVGYIATPEQFSDFTVVFSISVLSFLVSSAVLNNGAAIFSVRDYKGAWYYRLLGAVAALTSFLISFILSVMYSLVSDINFLTLVVSVPYSIAWVLSDVKRKVFLANGDSQMLFYKACFVLLLMAAAFYVGWKYSLEFTFLLTVISLILFVYFISGYFFLEKNVYCSESNRSVLIRHFKYGVNALSGSIAFWIYTQGLFLLANGIVEDGDIALFRVVQNGTGLVSIIYVALENYLLPRYVSKRMDGQVLTFHSICNKRWLTLLPIIVLLSGSSIYILFEYLFSAKYDIGSIYFTCVMISQFNMGCSRLYIVFFRSIEKPRIIALCHWAAALASMICFVIFFYSDDVEYVLLSCNLVSSLIFLFLILCIHRYRVKREIYL